VIDACVILDLLFLPTGEQNIFKKILSDNNVALVANSAIRLEVLKNSKSEAAYKKKKNFYASLVRAELPIDANTLKEAHSMAFAYDSLAPGASFSDLVLAGTIKRYPNTFLLTSNHKDFPVEVLDRVSGFTIEVGREIRALAIYSYNQDKFATAVARLTT